MYSYTGKVREARKEALMRSKLPDFYTEDHIRHLGPYNRTLEALEIVFYRATNLSYDEVLKKYTNEDMGFNSALEGALVSRKQGMTEHEAADCALRWYHFSQKLASQYPNPSN